MPTTNYNFFSWHNFTLISWSPDGKWIAFVDGAPGEELTSHARIYLLSTETMEAKQVPISPPCVGEGLPAFSHSGEYLAYWCFLSENGEAVLYSLPIRGGQPKAISPPLAFPRGLTWSADDKKLIYSLGSLGGGLSNELGEVTVANGSTKQLAFAGGAELPTVSPKGDKLAYSSLSTSFKHLAQGPASPGISGGRTHPFVAGTVRRSIFSGRKAHCLRVSPLRHTGCLDQRRRWNQPGRDLEPSR